MSGDLTRGKSGGTSRAERDIAAIALGLRVPGTHLRGIEHLVPPRPSGSAKSWTLDDSPA